MSLQKCTTISLTWFQSFTHNGFAMALIKCFHKLLRVQTAISPQWCCEVKYFFSRHEIGNIFVFNDSDGKLHISRSTVFSTPFGSCYNIPLQNTFDRVLHKAFNCTFNLLHLPLLLFVDLKLTISLYDNISKCFVKEDEAHVLLRAFTNVNENTLHVSVNIIYACCLHWEAVDMVWCKKFLVFIIIINNNKIIPHLYFFPNASLITVKLWFVILFVISDKARGLLYCIPLHPICCTFTTGFSLHRIFKQVIVWMFFHSFVFFCQIYCLYIGKKAHCWMHCLYLMF